MSARDQTLAFFEVAALKRLCSALPGKQLCPYTNDATQSLSALCPFWFPTPALPQFSKGIFPSKQQEKPERSSALAKISTDDKKN